MGDVNRLPRATVARGITPLEASMEKGRAVYGCQKLGLRLTVYEQCIEFDRHWLLTPLHGPRHQTILTRAITAVEVRGVRRKLYISTDGGQSYVYQLGGQNNEDARQAILSVL
jgi:hypothetical protein